MHRRRSVGRTAAKTGVGFATMALAGAAAVALPGAAGAAPLPSNCTAYTPPLASTRVVCEFDYTGAAQTFHVPDGVSELDVTAIGGQGQSTNNPGGLGAKVDGTVDVQSGADIRVLVGGNGSDGGFNGGGYGNGRGGGASDVRISDALDSRLIVAAGGGGAGTDRDGGNAGEDGSGDGAGTAASVDAPGTGGGLGEHRGHDGEFGNGGAGVWVSALNMAGGGGGGWYGGGGGGAVSDGWHAGGGGGGSSLVPEGGTMTLAGEDEAPSVTISYTICTGSVCQLAGSLGNLFGSLN
ncbi:glycine-rich protein [Tomitella gaofuii]|uniref:glycine-rich protein n=1 Tax=Tomitella gaofuii TaxID=2760083 RepID=UPI001EEB3FA8|nr:glycine-rich protein [Tomitella gaofuii]